MDWLTLTTYLQVHPEAGWLALSGLLLLLEVSTVPGVGFLFGGLGAMTLGGLMVAGMLPPEAASFYLQLACFLGFTVLWAAILWIPMRKSRAKDVPDFHNIVGTAATVGEGGLHRGRTGEIKWSGTTMRARISLASEHASIKEGGEVWIHALEGNTALVDTAEPKKKA